MNPSNPLLLLGVTAIAAVITISRSPAQVSIKVFADTTLSVNEGANRRTIPAGTDLTNGAQISVSGSSPCTTFASLSVNVSASTVDYLLNGSATGFLCQVVGGGGAIRVELRAPRPTAGRLELLFSPLAVFPNRSNRFAFDVGADGRVEFAQNPLARRGSAGLDVVVGTAGLKIRVDASFMFSGHIPLKVRFTPVSTKLTPRGSPCGPELVGRYVDLPQRREFVLSAHNAPVSTEAWFLFGVQQLAIPLPTANCLLRTDILLPVMTGVNPVGEAVLTLPLPPTVPKLDVSTQFLVFASGRGWATSNVVGLKL